MKIMRSQFFGALAFLLWAPVPFIYYDPPRFLLGHPLAIYAVVLVLGGVSAAATALLSTFRTRVSERAARAYVFIFILAFVGAYQFSGLAPSWQCFGKKLQAAVGRAAGQSCTTTCTNNDRKPCSGWSSCWDKFVSCSADGIDQGGRNCQGCCFSCDVVCEDPDPPSYQPPTISSTVNCSKFGNNGWCTGSTLIILTAADPQHFPVTISGDIDGISFICPAGVISCFQSLPEGSGIINYKVTASTSGLTATGSAAWKTDFTHPVANLQIPVPTGLDGWFKTKPVTISVTGSDSPSGLAIARLSADWGATWHSSSLSLSSDGTYVVYYGADDLAGNRTDYSGKYVYIDTTAPILSYSVSGILGTQGWYVSIVDVRVSASDSTSGIATVSILDNNGAPQSVPAELEEGQHLLTIIAIDKAGNSQTSSLAVRIDTSGPTITPSISGTLGAHGWYTSEVIVDATALDATSGLNGAIEVSRDNGSTWQSLPISLGEGIHSLTLRAYDKAGNLSTSSLTIPIDTTPPVLATSIDGTAGEAGWYVSNVTTTIDSSDTMSDIDRVEYNQNNTTWQAGNSITSIDGVNLISIRVFDQAGNMSSKSLEIKVDTIAPAVVPIIPTPNGLNNWFIQVPIDISVQGSDSGSGLLSAELSVNEGKWQPDASLSDGEYEVAFKSADNAGNTSTASRSVKIDTVAPSLSTSILGTAGNAGWYVSEARTTISARDETSNVDRIEYLQNKDGWQEGSSVVSKNGVNEISIRAYDLAGNMSTDSVQIRVDTLKPSSEFTVPINGSTDTLIRGTYALTGFSSDAASGAAGAEISLDGKSWLPAAMAADSTWSYDWDTSNWADGIYPVLVRTTDVAGNKELVESGAHATLIVNNAPPHIKLTPKWFIWQTGTLVIKTEYFPMRDGIIIIADKAGRWPSVKIPFEAKYPSQIKWDRKFANGILAPSGDYRVTVSACNIYDLCAEKSAIINIPWYAVVVPTSAVPTQMVEVKQEPKPPIKSPSVTATPPAIQLPTFLPEKEVEVEPKNESTLSLLPSIIFIALLWAVSSAALADKRPVAIRSIVKTIKFQKHIGEY